MVKKIKPSGTLLKIANNKPMSFSEDKINVNELYRPFDSAQGDCQTERSRSLVLLTKQR